MLVFVIGFTQADAQTSGGFATEQAKHGVSLFSLHCLQGHGDNLQGAAAPALTGRNRAIIVETRSPNPGKI